MDLLIDTIPLSYGRGHINRGKEKSTKEAYTYAVWSSCISDYNFGYLSSDTTFWRKWFANEQHDYGLRQVVGCTMFNVLWMDFSWESVTLVNSSPRKKQKHFWYIGFSNTVQRLCSRSNWLIVSLQTSKTNCFSRLHSLELFVFVWFFFV